MDAFERVLDQSSPDDCDENGPVCLGCPMFDACHSADDDSIFDLFSSN